MSHSPDYSQDYSLASKLLSDGKIFEQDLPCPRHARLPPLSKRQASIPNNASYPK